MISRCRHGFQIRCLHVNQIILAPKSISVEPKDSVSQVLKKKLRLHKSELRSSNQDLGPPVNSDYHRELKEKDSSKSDDALMAKVDKTFKSFKKRSETSPRKMARKLHTRKGQNEPSAFSIASPKDQDFARAKELEHEQIPRLAHALDRVLFSPGVHFLQDPRTRVFNFTPYLKKIVRYEDFNFDMVQHFVSASKDETLLKEAIKHGKQFYSSTSSMTSTLIQFYLFLNNYSNLLKSNFRFNFPNFTRTVENLPLSVIVEPQGVNPETGDTVYSVTSDKSTDVEILLGAMGHCLEALLTTDEEAFQSYLKHKEAEPIEQANVYNYLKYGNFLMRSQLDCYDPRLPGNGTFDLKTRAVCAIRYDRASDASENTYQIWKQNGQFESFEREYQDLVRTAGLLKYAFQARIGQMDGIFVAYHNVSTFFGFQYLPLSEIDKVFYSDIRVARSQEELLYSQKVPEKDDNMPSYVAETQFKMSLDLWQDIMKTAIKDLNHDGPFRLVTKRASSAEGSKVATQPASQLEVYAVPLTKEQVTELQQFPSKFQTSFKEEISQEERMDNLRDNRDQLIEFNKSIVKDTPVLSYSITADHLFNGCVTKMSHPFPYNDKAKWELRYEIKGNSTNDESTERYLLLMETSANMLTLSFEPAGKKEYRSDGPSLVEQMRMYSQVGKQRAAKWNKHESPPQQYTPL